MCSRELYPNEKIGGSALMERNMPPLTDKPNYRKPLVRKVHIAQLASLLRGRPEHSPDWREDGLLLITV